MTPTNVGRGKEPAKHPGARWPANEEETQMAKREIADTGTNKRYVRRDGRGRFTKDQSDVGRSLTQDRRKKAHTKAPKGQGDRGDR